MYYQMQTQRTGTHYISICQTSKRKFKKSQKYKYSTVRVVVGKKDRRGNYSYSNAFSKDDQEVYVKLKNLERGTYVLQVQIDWYQKNSRNFVISSYGAGKVGFS